jgi:hypothetical protein
MPVLGSGVCKLANTSVYVSMYVCRGACVLGVLADVIERCQFNLVLG